MIRPGRCGSGSKLLSDLVLDLYGYDGPAPGRLLQKGRIDDGKRRCDTVCSGKAV